MNGYNGYTRQYQENHILTASPEQILLMLYDGAIRFCNQAISASDSGKTTEKLGRISKIYAIITEFSDSLNHDVGGEIAANLDGLYQFMLRELNKARQDTSGKHLQVVAGLLADLRQTWGEAVEIKENEQGQLVRQQEILHDSEVTGTRLFAAG
jgi:flagellar protein FliS